MTENEIKWPIWLIFANFVEKWLILKTWRDCVSEVDFTHISMQNMLFLCYYYYNRWCTDVAPYYIIENTKTRSKW